MQIIGHSRAAREAEQAGIKFHPFDNAQTQEGIQELSNLNPGVVIKQGDTSYLLYQVMARGELSQEELVGDEGIVYVYKKDNPKEVYYTQEVEVEQENFVRFNLEKVLPVGEYKFDVVIKHDDLTYIFPSQKDDPDNFLEVVESAYPDSAIVAEPDVKEAKELLEAHVAELVQELQESGEAQVVPEISDHDTWVVGDHDTGKPSRGKQGEQGEKGDPLTFDDLTDEQKAALKGDQGPRGEQGPQGKQGEAGVPGPKGDRGEKGDPLTFDDLTDQQKLALKGEQGEKGPKGDTGPQGPRGLKGETGAKGAPLTFDDLTDEQKATLKGEPGKPGERGAKGDTGARGLKGDTGAPGKDGATGAKGDTGPQGPKGDTGAKGDTGPRGYTGSKGDTGAQGPKGDTGSKGDSIKATIFSQYQWDSTYSKPDGLNLIKED